MIRTLLFCLCATLVMGCSSPKNPAPENGEVRETNVPADQSDSISNIPADQGEDNLSGLIKNIKGHLPLMFMDRWLQLKDLELDASGNSLKLFLFNDENIRGNWWNGQDEKYVGKIIIAQIMYIPEHFDELLHSDSEELEELESDEDFLKAKENMTYFRMFKDLVKNVSEMGYSIKLNLHSRDNDAATIELRPEEAKDAVVFYRELLDEEEVNM
ncbi:MAG: hypothetical protein IKH02_00630 [Prevotella sp.]|nr:hypothetical protein [Prevotella sp.]